MVRNVLLFTLHQNQELDELFIVCTGCILNSSCEWDLKVAASGESSERADEM